MLFLPRCSRSAIVQLLDNGDVRAESHKFDSFSAFPLLWKMPALARCFTFFLMKKAQWNFYIFHKQLEIAQENPEEQKMVIKIVNSKV